MEGFILLFVFIFLFVVIAITIFVIWLIELVSEKNRLTSELGLCRYCMSKESIKKYENLCALAEVL